MEFRLADLKGKKVFAAKPVELYRSSKSEKSFRKVPAGGLIGKLVKYQLDLTGVNPRDLKSVKKARVWFIFTDSNGKDYGFYFQPGAGQINMQKFIDQGVKTEDQYSAENKAAYEKSPITAAAETVSETSKDFLKKYAPFIAAGLITVILITRK
jgi:hypothetical protein